MRKHRPGFPTGMILTPSIISRISSNQDYYDRNPERAEREYEHRQEEQRQVQEREAEEADWEYEQMLEEEQRHSREEENDTD